jgi:DNA-binding NtrC family response regulator
MKILIVENEHYLAQSISTNLMSDKNVNYFLATSINDAINMKENFDILLLSTNISGNIYNVIEKFKNSIIILLVSYINHDTVTLPIKAGANDYIMKPFMMEELHRKISHHINYQNLQEENNSLKEYFDFSFEDVDTQKLENPEFPLFLKSKSRLSIDKAVFELANKKNEVVIFCNVLEKNALKKLSKTNRGIIYIVNFDTLKISEQDEILKIVDDKKAIISIDYDNMNYLENMVEITDTTQMIMNNDILSIEDYVKYSISNYENRYPDTELSKKLGISRKSLWEKRKKYGLFKKR